MTTRQLLYRALRVGPATAADLAAKLPAMRLDTIQRKLLEMRADGQIRICRYERKPTGGFPIRTYCIADGQDEPKKLPRIVDTDHGKMMKAMDTYRRNHGFVPVTFQLTYANRRRIVKNTEAET